MTRADNPFSTKFIRPGAMDYFFPDGTSPETLLDRFAAQGWCGAIVGPHGSGKSSLLESLKPAFAERDTNVLQYTLHDGERRLPKQWWKLVEEQRKKSSARLVLFIDGYEQLSMPATWQVRRTGRRRGLGLLVTAHGAVPLPTLWETAVSEALLQVIVKQLLADTPESGITSESIQDAWNACPGNLREALFTLYDDYERQRRC